MSRQFCCQISGLVVQIPIGDRKDVVKPHHCGRMALLSRSVRRRFFSSQNSGVTGIQPFEQQSVDAFLDLAFLIGTN